MNGMINNLITALNNTGRAFCDFSIAMFIQASVLIVVLLIIDILIRKRVRATFRYCIWMLVFIKLILPPALSLPTGIGNWFGEYFVVSSENIDRRAENINEESSISSESFGTEFSPQQVRDFQNFSRTDMPQITETQEVSTAPQVYEPDITSANSITWQGGIFLIWLVGVLVLSVLLIQRIFFVKGLIAQSEPAKNRLLDTLQECSTQLGIKRNIQMKLSHNASSPAVCGLFNPVILIPANLLSKISHEKFKAILIHELSHIKRNDLLVNCAQTILQILYFYNPLLWLANSIVRKIREQAVDEMVLVALGADFGELSRTEAISYTTTLIDVAEMAFSRPALSLRLVGVVESKKALSERIKHILSRPFPKSAKLGILGLIVIIIFAAIALPMAEMTGISVELKREVVLPYSVWMADIDSNDNIKILDFASGDIIERSGFNNESEFFNKVNSMIEGDVYVCYNQNHNKPMITFFKSAGLDGKRPSNEYQFISPIPMEIPWVTTVWTRQGCKYQFTLVSFDEDNCVIEYKPLNRAAEKAMVEGQTKSSELPERHLSGNKTYKYGEPIQLLFEHAGINSDKVVWEQPKDWSYDFWLRINGRDYWSRTSFHPFQSAGWGVKLSEVFEDPFSNKPLELKPGKYKVIAIEKGVRGVRKGMPNRKVYFGDILSNEIEFEIVDQPVHSINAVLPNGVNVELLGICEYPSEGKQWWKPDGTLLEQKPYDQLTITPIPDAKSNEKVYEFAYRMSKGIDSFDISVMGGIIKEHGGFAIGPYKNGEPVGDIRSHISYLPKDQELTTITISTIEHGGYVI